VASHPPNDDKQRNDKGGDLGNTLLGVVVGGILAVVLTFVAFGGFPGTKHEYASISVTAPTTTR